MDLCAPNPEQLWLKNDPTGQRLSQNFLHENYQKHHNLGSSCGKHKIRGCWHSFAPFCWPQCMLKIRDQRDNLQLLPSAVLPHPEIAHRQVEFEFNLSRRSNSSFCRHVRH